MPGPSRGSGLWVYLLFKAESQVAALRLQAALCTLHCSCLPRVTRRNAGCPCSGWQLPCANPEVPCLTHASSCLHLGWQEILVAAHRSERATASTSCLHRCPPPSSPCSPLTCPLAQSSGSGIPRVGLSHSKLCPHHPLSPCPL